MATGVGAPDALRLWQADCRSHAASQLANARVGEEPLVFLGRDLRRGGCSHFLHGHLRSDAARLRASYQLRSVRLLIRRPSHIVTRLYRMCSFQRFTKQSLSGLCHTNMEGSDVRSRQPACTTSCPRPCRARHEVEAHHRTAASERLQRACGSSGVRQGHAHGAREQERRCCRQVCWQLSDETANGATCAG